MPTDPNYLRKVSCFRDLSDEQLSSLAEITDVVCYPAGYTLFEEGKPGKRLFYLLKGDVKVYYHIGENDHVPVDMLSSEELAGCSALIQPYIYTATERSLTEVEVLETDAEALRRMMEADCGLGFAIQQHVITFLMDRITNFRLEC